jgi:hypothetical protein
MSNKFYLKKNCPFYEIMWKRVLRPDGPQFKIQRMFILWRIATNIM